MIQSPVAVIAFVSVLLGTVAVALGQSPGPDIIAGDIWGSPINWGKTGGITGYSVGTISCNQGDAEVSWIATNNHHPVQGTQLYRLKDGRFEQIGLCWVMHEFLALAYDDCSLGCVPPNPYTGFTLGVGCSNPDNASINGKQTRLGPRGHINAYTGYFPYPFTSVPNPPPAYYEAMIGRRLQVHDADLDPALNPAAAYFLEVQFIAADDFAAGNGNNNVSYRPVIVSDAAGGVYNLTLTGSIARETPAIHAWKLADNSVEEASVIVPNDGRFMLATTTTNLGGGIWHYEYAVYNMNCDRSGQSFFVPVPVGTTLSNIGFHDVAYHSGDSDPNAPSEIRGTDWSATTTGDGIDWHTDVWVPTDRQANALRWGTVYNFRFDADRPPAPGVVVLGLYKPGTPTAVSVGIPVPQQSVGACCVDYSTCVANTVAATCTMLGGDWQGGGTICDPNTCPDPPSGACCDRASGTCTIASPLECVGPEYVYQGDGTSCDPAPCLGACCMPDESCIAESTASWCEGVEGRWQGVDSECGSVDCSIPPTGACCNRVSGTCLVVSPLACVGSDDAYQGDRTTCEPNPCLGACCMPDESCVAESTAVWCASVQGRWRGLDSECPSVICTIPTVSEWGNAALFMLLFLAAAILFRRWVSPQSL